MFKRVNSNKNGVIEYSIDNIEDVDKLPRKETDNTVYAILNKNGKIDRNILKDIMEGKDGF